MPRNKEKRDAYLKEYYQKNKEKILLHQKEYQEKNKKSRQAYREEYRKTEKEIKRQKFKSWKSQGIVCDYNAIYDIYINTHQCDFCKKDFKNSYDRCLDHDHNTGDVRGILCRSCNSKDVLSVNEQNQ